MNLKHCVYFIGPTGEPDDYFRFTKFGLKYLLEESGFKPLEISVRGGVFSLLSQLIISKAYEQFNLFENNLLRKLFYPIHI